MKNKLWINQCPLPDVWALQSVGLVSTDVFDTLLLRNRTSERTRILLGEQRFSAELANKGSPITVDRLIDARLQAQKWAFRALNIGGSGEVRLADIITRQLTMLGLPITFADERMAIETEIEKGCLAANHALANLLRRYKATGGRVVAISDTTLSARQVCDLITFFHGPELIDRVYASADEQATKRQGKLFTVVGSREAVPLEKLFHFGDDKRADQTVPTALGFQTCHVPRGRMSHHLRTVDGAATEGKRQLRRKTERQKHHAPPTDATTFGRDILGPIVVQFCLLIWLYTQQAQATHKTALLFCARGGIGIRAAFERLLEQQNLPLSARRANLLISRLVAARAAVLTQSRAALQELGREFRDASVADVARALGGRSYDLPDSWQQRFDPDTFYQKLFGPDGLAVLADIQRQNALFTRHFDEIVGDATRIILCDTGLYGSTQRLLAAGFPNQSIETIQFARANYKKHSEDHFPRLSGLLVEQNLYNPLSVETCSLRYWHLIESLFEPAIPSVRVFDEDEQGAVAANSGPILYGSINPAINNALLTGALEYIDQLPRSLGGATALSGAHTAWHRLQAAITRPTAADIACLDVGPRSVDFGRSGTVSVLNPSARIGLVGRLGSIKAHLWREGAIAREFPRLKPVLLSLLESAHTLRGVSSTIYR